MNVNLSNPNLTWNSEKDVPIELLGQDRMNVNLSKPKLTWNSEKDVPV